MGAPSSCAESAEASARSIAQARVPRVQSDGGSGTIGPSRREGKPRGGCRDLGKCGGVLGLGAATQREPAAREQLEAVRPPAAGDERQLLTTGAAEEQFDSLFRLPGFEQDACEPNRGPCRDEALVEVARELDALLRSGERQVQVADGDRDDGSVEEVPGKGRRRPEQPRRLDGTVQKLCGLGQLAAHVPDPGQDRVQAVQGVPPHVRASEPEGTTRVEVGLGVQVEVDLGDSEPPRHVGADRELVVGQVIHEGCGFVAAGSGDLGRSGHRVREGAHDRCRRHEERVSQYPSRAHPAPGPVAHRLVSRAVELVQGQLDP